MGKRGMLREGQPAFRHWGSSLSLEGDDPGLGEITRRTLREGRAMSCNIFLRFTRPQIYSKSKIVRYTG